MEQRCQHTATSQALQLPTLPAFLPLPMGSNVDVCHGDAALFEMYH
jgi:hypothetical protein